MVIRMTTALPTLPMQFCPSILSAHFLDSSLIQEKLPHSLQFLFFFFSLLLHQISSPMKNCTQTSGKTSPDSIWSKTLLWKLHPAFSPWHAFLPLPCLADLLNSWQEALPGTLHCNVLVIRVFDLRRLEPPPSSWVPLHHTLASQQFETGSKMGKRKKKQGGIFLDFPSSLWI